MNEQNTNNSFNNPKKQKKKSGCVEVLVVCIGIFIAFFFIIPTLLTSNIEEDREDNQKKIQSETTQKPKIKENVSKEDKEKKSISKKDYIRKCKEYDYKKVLRNPSKYVGKKIKVRLKISQVHEESILNASKYYFAYSNDEYDMWIGNEYAIIDMRDKEKPKILEEDIIEVYGEIAEPEQTKSLLMASNEVFSINMKYSKLIKG